MTTLPGDRLCYMFICKLRFIFIQYFWGIDNKKNPDLCVTPLMGSFLLCSREMTEAEGRNNDAGDEL